MYIKLFVDIAKQFYKVIVLSIILPSVVYEISSSSTSLPTFDTVF